MGRAASFATTFGAQTGLAITPIVCFGTEAQKAKYLSRLVNGELVGAYALSESGSGSDALGAKARATRQPDGSFTISGEKMWITNGGFADLFIVFAKVVGERRGRVHRLPRGASISRRQQRQGRTQDGAARIVDDAADSPGRAGAGRERARRDRQGTQGRVQRPELWPLQAGRDVQRRRTRDCRRSGEVRGPTETVRPANRRRLARSSTSSPRWRFASSPSRACCTEQRR